MNKPSYHYTVGDLFRIEERVRNPYIDSSKNEVGVEIEIEGQNCMQDVFNYWRVDRDGSLEGDSAEYILAVPEKRENVFPALHYLQETLYEKGCRLKESNRTGTHVHLNFMDRPALQVYNTIVLYGNL